MFFLAMNKSIYLSNSEEHGINVGTVRYSSFNLVGQDKTKSVYSTISVDFNLHLKLYYLHRKV